MEEALALEELDLNYYRSKKLYKPVWARGVFGGQVIGQALNAATATVPEQYFIHSLHSYFILPGDNSLPILYEVQRVRNGKSYCTRMVMAKQKGRCILSLNCSFALLENGQPLRHQYPMPECPDPETLPTLIERLKSWSNHPEVPRWYKSYMEKKLVAEMEYPVDSRNTDRITFEDLSHPKKTTKQCVWLKAKGNLGDNLALHKCALAYASDDSFLLTAIRPHGMTPFHQMMMASLCHSIWFHDPYIRADEWLLCEMESPQSANGRGLAFGRIFTRDGRLVASTAQEGVIRVIQKDRAPKANF